MTGTVDQQRLSGIREVQRDGSVLIVGKNVRFRLLVLKPEFMLMAAKGGSLGP